MDIDKFITDARKSKMPYAQLGKAMDPIDTSNIPDDEPFTSNMINRPIDKMPMKRYRRT